jgi:putative Holliday junction resolvase
VAISDPGRVLASPVGIVVRSGDADADRRAIAELAKEWEAALVVVGLPLSMDGTVGPAAEAALAEAAALAELLDVPVETFDERLTTVTADRQLRAANVGGRARRKVIDQAAAAVMLQAWLDGQQAGPPV